MFNLDSTEKYGFAIIGQDIKETIAKAFLFLNDHPTGVYFQFNGIRVEVTSETTPASVFQKWKDDSEESYQAYLRSDESKKRDLERATRANENQRILDQARQEAEILDLTNMDHALSWVNQWYNAADDVDVKWSPSEMQSYLTNSGWKAGDCVGHPDVKTDKVIMGRWLLGQAMSCMNSMMPPHPVFGTFYEKYLAM